jgi:Transposase, Mutator family
LNNDGLPDLRLLPDAPSRTVAPYSPARTPRRRGGRGSRKASTAFHTDTNTLERLNKEIRRRTDVVGIFPNDRSLIRLAASIVIEQNDEWLVGRRYLSAHSLEAVLDQDTQDKHRKETRQLTTA